MSWIMVDAEADGPCPGLYSMTEVGAIVVREDEETAALPAFYGRLAPISDMYMQEALDVCNRTREETMAFPNPETTMREFAEWLEKYGGNRPMFISDNNGFDFQFVNYYFWRFLGKNPFGYSSTNLGSLFKGVVKDTFQSFKYLRKGIPHDHHPVNDARGNALALLRMKEKFDLKIALK